VIDGAPHHTRAPDRGSERSFGLVFATFFVLVAVRPLASAGPVRMWALGAAVIAALLGLFAPAVLAPLNIAWTRLGDIIGRVVSPIALAALFFLAVTPIALLMRLAGKDPLRLKGDPDASSYWILREPAGPAPESLSNQF
jgi:hypothetical protein